MKKAVFNTIVQLNARPRRRPVAKEVRHEPLEPPVDQTVHPYV
ncbi:hypothetical protein [Exiguobacterium undae]